jgi:hypothetical protein
MTRIKATLGVFVIAVIAGAFAVAGQARLAHHPPRHGALHVTKECSQYDGTVGAFCTITSSNIPAIQPGMNVVYLASPGASELDSDIALSSGNGGAAVGHVVLDLNTARGPVTFSAGTGRFEGFHARADVSVDSDGVWHWDGTYRFTGDD